MLAFYRDIEKDDNDKMDYELCREILKRLEAVPQGKRQTYWEQVHEELQVDFYEATIARPVRLAWMKFLPDATFIPTLIVIVLPICIVLLVRSKVGIKKPAACERDRLERWATDVSISCLCLAVGVL
jgi:hypothetical protein